MFLVNITIVETQCVYLCKMYHSSMMNKIASYFVSISGNSRSLSISGVVWKKHLLGTYRYLYANCKRELQESNMQLVFQACTDTSVVRREHSRLNASWYVYVCRSALYTNKIKIDLSILL